MCELCLGMCKTQDIIRKSSLGFCKSGLGMCEFQDYFYKTGLGICTFQVGIRKSEDEILKSRPEKRRFLRKDCGLENITLKNCWFIKRFVGFFNPFKRKDDKSP